MTRPPPEGGPARRPAPRYLPGRPPSHVTALTLAVGATSLSLGCTPEPPRDPGVRVGIVAEPHTLLPPFVTDLVGAQVADLLYDRLADPGPASSPLDPAGYRPGLALAWAWNADSTAIRFTLDPRARWHDGVPVTSRDVQFTYALLRDPLVAAPHATTAVRVIDSVSTPDPRTAVVWLRRRGPTVFHDLTYEVHVLPAHCLDTVPRDRLDRSALATVPVGSGPFRFVRWDRGSALVLEANRAYRGGRPVPPRVVLRVLPSPDAAANALVAGEVDVLDYVRPQDARRLAASERVRLLTLPGYDYAFVQFNLHAPGASGRPHPVFADRGVRRALALAIDRTALVGNVLGAFGRPALGPVTRAQATADTGRTGDTGLPPYDPGLARHTLDALGWRPGPDGVRRRAGVQLSFDLLVPTSSANRRQAAVLLQAMFAAVGAEARVQAIDAAAVNAALEAGHFDAALQGLRVDPSPRSIADVWTTAAGRRVGGDVEGFNYGGYTNPQVDAWVDSAATAPTPAAALRLYRSVYAAVAADAPAIFLYEPASVVAVSRRLVTVGVRADAWWAGLAQWRSVRMSGSPSHR